MTKKSAVVVALNLKSEFEFQNPCYPRNPWLNLFCDKRSYFRGRHRAEEYPQHLFPPDHAHQFVHRAVHGNHHEQNDLDSPEMRPPDFLQHQYANKRHDMQSHEKVDRWWEQLEELFF